MSPYMPQSHSEMVKVLRQKVLDKERLSPYEAGYDYRWRKLRIIILARDPICKLCGRKPSFHVDHIIPKAEGGRDSMENLQGTCHSCHSKKTMKEQRSSNTKG